MTISNKAVETFAKGVPWSKAIKKAASTSKGQRIFPSQNTKNDQKWNFRLDKGSEVDGKQELILQANKNAENKGVRDAAGKDSHAVLAKVLVDPVNDKDGKTAIRELLSSFKDNKK